MTVKLSTNFDAVGLQVRTLVDVFDVLSPREYPFLKWSSGGSDKKPSLNNLSNKITSNKYEWGEQPKPLRATTLTASVTTTDGTTITVPAAAAPLLLVGKVIKIDNELMLVTVKGSASTGQVGVSRAFANSTASAHDAGAVVRVVSTAHIEGADSDDDHYQPPTLQYNYIQEIVREARLSHIRRALKTYGEKGDPLDVEIERKMHEVLLDLEGAVWEGLRAEPTSTSPGAMGGFLQYTPAAHIQDLNGASFQRDHMTAALQTIYAATNGAQIPDTVFCNIWGAHKLTEIYGPGLGREQFTREANDRMGGMVVDTIVTEIGSIAKIIDPHMPADWIVLAKSGTIKLGPVPGLELGEYELHKTGTADARMIAGVYTSEWHEQYSRWVFTGISRSN